MSDDIRERFPLAPTKCPVCAANLVVYGEQTMFVPGTDDADFDVVILRCTAPGNDKAHAVLLTDCVDFGAWDDGTDETE